MPHNYQQHPSSGKCSTCGLSTGLPIHQECGKNHPTNVKKKHRKKVICKDKVCENVDCKKTYIPRVGNQKLCDECLKLKNDNKLNYVRDATCRLF